MSDTFWLGIFAIVTLGMKEWFIDRRARKEVADKIDAAAAADRRDRKEVADRIEATAAEDRRDRKAVADEVTKAAIYVAKVADKAEVVAFKVAEVAEKADKKIVPDLEDTKLFAAAIVHAKAVDGAAISPEVVAKADEILTNGFRPKSI